MLYVGKKPINMKYSLAAIMGVFSTMPIVGIPLGGGYTTLFSITFVLYFAVLVWNVFAKNCTSFGLSRLKLSYLLFLIWPLFSYIVGLFYMPNEWHSSMTSYTIKVLEYLAITLLLYMDNDVVSSKAFARGLLAGIIANAIWSVFEAITYYFFRSSLNDIIFSRFLGLNRDVLIWNSFGGIRVSGFNYDPAHLGGILPILMCVGLFKGNLLLIILTIISLAFSQSTTALVGCIVVFVIYIFTKGLQKKKITSKTVTAMALICVIGVVSLVLLSSNGVLGYFAQSLMKNIEGYIARIDAVYVKSNATEPRVIYYTQAIDRLIDRGPIVSIMGSGLGTSMYPFRNVVGLFASGSQNTVTEIETNYIAYLFDLGIVGLFFYLSFLVLGYVNITKVIKKLISNTSFVYLGVFISVICCSALYHYIFTAYQILAFSFATVYVDYLLNDSKEVESCQFI